MQTYLVGGAVRDQLLGRPVKERDWVVVGGSPEAMRARGFQTVGHDFPVFLHPETGEEYALARTERKTAPGYHGFQFDTDPGVTLEADLARRDLTINAMAQTPDGQIIDPYGGQADLRAGYLRHVSDAFAEDPVRILRLARFAARFVPLGFRVADETRALMGAMVADGEVDALVPERVWQEWERALGEARPRAFIEVLHEVGAARVILPELERVLMHPAVVVADVGRIQPGPRSLDALDAAVAAETERPARFAALLHGLGWPQAAADGAPARRPPQRAPTRIETLCQRLRVPNAYREVAGLTARYEPLCRRAGRLPPAALLCLLKRLDAGRRPERFRAVLEAAAAVYRADYGATGAYPPGAWLKAMQDTADSVDAQAVIAEGYRGRAIAEALDQRRVAAIAERRRVRVEAGPGSNHLND